jgi:hypothetical protein
MVMESGLSRRSLLKIGAGCGAAAVLSPLGRSAALAAPPTDKGGRLIPASKVGTITFTQRDVPGRLAISTGGALLGYLGGANFPADPNDLGPLVPVPGGWKELFEYFAKVGITQVEFAGYGQNAANPGGAAPNPVVGAIQGVPSSGEVTAASAAAYLAYARTLRGFLDDNGLEAIGNHGFIPTSWPGPNSTAGPGVMYKVERDRFNVELEFGAILGTPFLGTGGDPTSANDRNIEPWTIAGEKWTALNEISVNQFGIHMYTHNHDPAYGFLQDGPMVEVTVSRQSGLPLATPQIVRGESGKRLMQHYLDITPAGLVQVEMDIYWAHVAQHIHRWRYDWEGNRVEDIFDPLAQVQAQTMRYPLYHAKDGDSTGQAPGVGAISGTGTQGSNQGYTMIPFGDPRSDIDFATFFKEQGARGYHNPNYEQDNAPGPANDVAATPTAPAVVNDRGRSLRFTHISAANMNALRG